MLHYVADVMLLFMLLVLTVAMLATIFCANFLGTVTPSKSKLKNDAIPGKVLVYVAVVPGAFFGFYLNGKPRHGFAHT